MKITMVGGGALRVLGIMRGALAVPQVLDKGEIYLFDLNLTRAEAMGRMLLKTPELKRAQCNVRWGDQLEEALTGADIVGMILPASRPKSFQLGTWPSINRGFISSDNVSPNGAVSAIKIAPVVLNIARAMEKYCPDAWLVNFVNPVAVLSGMVNNHLKIRALGVCQGFTNHLWDVSRLFGRDEEAKSLHVEAAGINHLSYILKGTRDGEDLLAALERRMNDNWQMCELQPWWNESSKKNIRNSITKLVRVWRELGVLIFSTEGDGMAHLMYEEALAESRAHGREVSGEELDQMLKQQAENRAGTDRQFQAWLSHDLDDAFWENQWREDSTFKVQEEDIFVRIFSALAGAKETIVATSRPNYGAISGIKDRQVVEYTQIMRKNEVRPLSEKPYDIPDVVHGLTASLAAHQTMLGDALATEDPELLAHALLSYPVQPYSRNARSLYKELFQIAGSEIKPAYAKAIDYL